MNFQTLCLIISVFTSTSGTIFSPSEEESIVTLVNEVIECRHIPGLSLSVVKNGDVWTRGFGVADFTSGRPVEGTSMFSIGSLGKAFTVTLLEILLEETGYHWDTKLSDIEGVDLTFKSEQLTRNATLADLLAHRTGLSTVADYGFIGGYPPGTDITFLSRRLKYLHSLSTFRSSFVYNNMMYMVLGHVIEVLGKDSWESLMTSRVLEPIGMGFSRVLDSADELVMNNSAKPYIFKDGVMQEGNHTIYNITPLESAGGLLSNAVDMATWMLFNLKNGTASNDERLVDPDRFAKAFETHNDVPSYFGGNLNAPAFPVNDITPGYGFGWFDSTYRGLNRKWHSGGLFSYVSQLWLFPDQQIGVFGTTNGPAIPSVPGLGLKTILSYISDIILNEEPWLNYTTACTFPSPWRTSSKFTHTPPETYTNDNLTDFIGTYGNYLLPDIEINVSENSTGDDKLTLNWNRIKGELLPTSDGDAFKFKMSEPWEYAIERVISDTFTLTYAVKFERNDNGDVDMFNIVLDTREGLDFRKDVRFRVGESETSTADKIKYSCICLLLFPVVIYDALH